MGLRFDPVGGGQLKNTVKQLIEIERQPIRALEARKAIEETKMKLFGEFKSKFTGLDGALGLLTSFKNFRELKAELGEGDKLMSVTIDKEKADPGTYEIQIDQLARRSSAISGGYEDAEKAIVGMGYIVFDRPDGE
ncbi:MAG: flagellar cap protein FliD N-terminal domain-containing protein, partial [Bdellovibrionota bacterium]